MRVTTGKLKGRTINVPDSKELKPSQDQVRLAIFSMLESGYLSGFYYDELTVADLFAGTGALGIEAISRGVERVDFVEHTKKHTKMIEKTLHEIQCEKFAKIYAEDINKFLTRPVREYYDIVFLDPPYKMFDEIKLDNYVPLLKEHGVLIYLHSERNYPKKQIKTDLSDAIWELQDTREYGATGVSIYTQE